MPFSRLMFPAFLAASLLIWANNASSEDYPNRPIRIVTSQPGAGDDFIARLVAQGITGAIGQSVIVENRGGSILPAIYVSKALPDGYTLLAITGVLWTAPLLQKVAYDPVKDFSPVSLVMSSPLLLAVNPALSAKSVQELIFLAKTKPGALNYVSGGTGGASNLAAELFKVMAGVNITSVPYNGVGPGLIALIGGQVQIIFTSTTAAGPHVKAGKLRALAITALRPSPLAPGVPTIAESGLPKYEWQQMTGILAPSKTPDSIIRKLNQEIVLAISKEGTKAILLNIGAEAVGSSPTEFAEKMTSEITKTRTLIEETGIHAE